MKNPFVAFIIGLSMIVTTSVAHALDLSPAKVAEQVVEASLKKVEGTVDKQLEKNGLPTIKQMQATLKCVPPLLKQLQKILYNPKDKKLIDSVYNGKCAKELRLLKTQCGNPLLVPVSMFTAMPAHVCGIVATTLDDVDKIYMAANMAENLMEGKGASDSAAEASAESSSDADSSDEDSAESNTDE